MCDQSNMAAAKKRCYIWWESDKNLSHLYPLLISKCCRYTTGGGQTWGMFVHLLANNRQQKPDVNVSWRTFPIGVSPLFFWAAISAYVQNCRKLLLSFCPPGHLCRQATWRSWLDVNVPSGEAFPWLVVPVNAVHWLAVSPEGERGYSKRWCPEALWEEWKKSKTNV